MLTYKDMRTEMGMTQSQVGTYLDKSKSSISLIEAYKRGMNLTDFLKFYGLYVEKTGKTPNILTDITHK